MQFTELTYEEKGQLAAMVITLLDNWELGSEAQIDLLSLPENTPTRAIRKYRKCTPFPESDKLEERVEHLVGIAEALRTTYPRNQQMGSQWMNKPNRKFDGKTPITVMMERGLDGIVAVRAHLDCSFAWQKYAE